MKLALRAFAAKPLGRTGSLPGGDGEGCILRIDFVRPSLRLYERVVRDTATSTHKYIANNAHFYATPS